MIYRTFLDCESEAQICSSNVDLPIPGSPPINTNDPLTIPPPSTRLNSLDSVRTRGVDSFLILSNVCTFPAVSLDLTPCLGLAAFSTISSIWFHAPQLGHFPIHFGD
ncbi:Uncharacterised protein [Streptococcus pneumoniae]|nr:Uncharacterised protein [Streptococcus pneumoniae]